MAEIPERIMEEREELMVSVNGEGIGIPALRMARFLKPCVGKLLSTSPTFPAPSSSNNFNRDELLAKLKLFKHDRDLSEWNAWVHHLLPTHQATWKQAGIFNAIISSTYTIRRYDNLVLGVAEKWCSETNTFIFPWGEASITLEYMMVLGGFSVLGEPVGKYDYTTELAEVEGKLGNTYSEISRKNPRTEAKTRQWITYFMSTGHEVEHEAFLCLWLSKFVFPNTAQGDSIRKHVFQISFRLARGTLIALAPAVLASIYRDMSTVKEKIAYLSTEGNKKESPTLRVVAPFQLVQLWIWERFPTLRPHPNCIKDGEPRSAMWHNLNGLRSVDVRLAVDNAGQSFQWRPYARAMDHFIFNELHREKEQSQTIDLRFNQAMEAFARCVRVSEIVGIDYCIRQYLPHRVAMQFGFDLDIPESVVRCISTPPGAWNNYNRPIKDAGLHMPPSLSETCATVRYIEWWRKSNPIRKDVIRGIMKQRKRSLRMRPTLKRLKALESIVHNLAFENDSTSVPVKLSLMGRPDKKLWEEVTLRKLEKQMEVTTEYHGKNSMEISESLEKNVKSCSADQTRSPVMEMETKIENPEMMVAEVKATFSVKLNKDNKGGEASNLIHII